MQHRWYIHCPLHHSHCTGFLSPPPSSSDAILNPSSKPFSQNQSLNQIKGLGGSSAEASRGESHWGDCCHLPSPKAFQNHINPAVLWRKTDPLWTANCHIRHKVHGGVHNHRCQKPLSHIIESVEQCRHWDRTFPVRPSMVCHLIGDGSLLRGSPRLHWFNNAF